VPIVPEETIYINIIGKCEKKHKKIVVNARMSKKNDKNVACG